MASFEQQAWADSYTGEGDQVMMQEQVYRNNIFVRRLRNPGRLGRRVPVANPNRLNMDINLQHPEDETSTAVPEEYVLVATFHTHPTVSL
ncbi:hypothetical protein H0H87_002664 [Tephrocybe sp. NHM501043]|nr:hypothetical protein H0H87_002664 [Tephrocybe sp. NHM501043]